MDPDDLDRARRRRSLSAIIGQPGDDLGELVDLDDLLDGDHELDRGELLEFGPATRADLAELDAVPEPVDSDAPTDIHARTMARARP